MYYQYTIKNDWKLAYTFHLQDKIYLIIYVHAHIYIYNN